MKSVETNDVDVEPQTLRTKIPNQQVTVYLNSLTHRTKGTTLDLEEISIDLVRLGYVFDYPQEWYNELTDEELTNKVSIAATSVEPYGDKWKFTFNGDDLIALYKSLEGYAIGDDIAIVGTMPEIGWFEGYMTIATIDSGPPINPGSPNK